MFHEFSVRGMKAITENEWMTKATFTPDVVNVACSTGRAPCCAMMLIKTCFVIHLYYQCNTRWSAGRHFNGTNMLHLFLILLVCFIVTVFCFCLSFPPYLSVFPSIFKCFFLLSWKVRWSCSLFSTKNARRPLLHLWNLPDLEYMHLPTYPARSQD